MKTHNKQDGALPRTPEDLERKYNLGAMAKTVEALKKAAKNGNKNTEEILPIEKGGTGASTEAEARSNLGITPENIGARPNNWTPSASDVGAVPNSRKVNNKALSSDITLSASDVGARPNNWMPTASDVGARPDTWMPTAEDVGALALSGGTLTGELNCKNINASNEYLKGSLYVGGKKSTTDGKTGVAFGASGNITMQGADTPTLNFIHGSSTSPQASINMAGNTYQLHFKSKGNMLFYPISTNNTYFALLANAMYHSADNAVACGASTKRWSTVYAGTGTINTSDRNEKENIRDIDEKYIRLFEKLRPVTYEFIGGNHDRIHIGYISQEVKEAMDEVGLTDLDFAGYCRDKKTEDVLDENGVLVGQKDVLDENGEQAYLYALRYAEFIALNTKMIQLQQKKIEAMERELRELKEKQK